MTGRGSGTGQAEGQAGEGRQRPGGTRSCVFPGLVRESGLDWSHTGMHWAAPDCTGLHQAEPGYTMLIQAAVDWHWAALCCTGLNQATLC